MLRSSVFFLRRRVCTKGERHKGGGVKLVLGGNTKQSIVNCQLLLQQAEFPFPFEISSPTAAPHPLIPGHGYLNGWIGNSPVPFERLNTHHFKWTNDNSSCLVLMGIPQMYGHGNLLSLVANTDIKELFSGSRERGQSTFLSGGSWREKLWDGLVIAATHNVFFRTFPEKPISPWHGSLLFWLLRQRLSWDPVHQLCAGWLKLLKGTMLFFFYLLWREDRFRSKSKQGNKKKVSHFLIIGNF